MTSLVPSKSQPLHNFSLPHLKWKNHRSGRSRLAGETSSSSPPHRSPSTPWRESPSPSIISRRPSPLHKQSPMRDSESESEQTFTVPIQKSTKSTKLTKSNKICIRFHKNENVPEESSPEVTVTPPSAAEEEESVPKTWNLRPRRPPISNKQFNGGLPKIGSSPLPENKTCNRSNLNREISEMKNNDLLTSHKQKFSIALSRDEIEEDIFSLTGSKPSRRPKKRPRTVQKQLDVSF